MSEAQRLLERDLTVRPDDGQLHFHLAKVLAANGQAAEATSHLQNAVTVDPDWAFWSLREAAFSELFQQRPALREELNELAVVPIVERIRKTATITG